MLNFVDGEHILLYNCICKSISRGISFSQSKQKPEIRKNIVV